MNATCSWNLVGKMHARLEDSKSKNRCTIHTDLFELMISSLVISQMSIVLFKFEFYKVANSGVCYTCVSVKMYFFLGGDMIYEKEQSADCFDILNSR